ncbi:putative phage abortive infection protein [Oceanicaulis sp. LC35]|uniref:putative phage abortive infection protein n=1 Tax=Oceanicaulis sp. LC35 TaxID=3349635 RepID=UPI003F835399
MNSNPKSYRAPFALSAVVFFLALCAPLAIYLTISFGLPLSINIDDYAAFGGLIAGSIGTGFLALTFFAVLYGIFVQNFEFNALQREMREQNFERNINSHKETYIQTLTNINVMKPAGNGPIIKIGLEAIRFNNELSLNSSGKLYYEVDMYEKARDKISNGLDHYLRVVFHYFKFLDTKYKNETDQQTKEKYRLEIRLFQSRLSEPELALMALNGLSIHGSERMKPLIEDWGLLENLPETTAAKFRYTTLQEYSASAFGNNSDKILKPRSP